MQPLKLWPVVAALVACAGQASEWTDTSAAAPSRAIFREVRIEEGTLRLGEPVERLSALGIVLADTLVRLHDAAFGGAQAILLHLGPGDTLRGMTYEYGRDTDFETRVADYVTTLGPPMTRSQRGQPDVDLTDVVVWEDSLTRFELQWVARRTGAESRSILRDRQRQTP